jgi:type IV pilus assembly protein PilO
MGAFGKLKWYLQVIIVLVVCGALFGGVWYFFMQPIQVTIADQTKRLDEISKKVADSKKKKATFEQFKKESDALEAKLNELKKVLPQDRETDQILNRVQVSAATSGLKIVSGVQKAAIDHEVYTEWPLEMEVIGTYHNLGAFLQKMRQLDRIVNISKLRIDTKASEGEAALSASITANYEASTFVYREEIAKEAPAPKAVKAKK